MEASSSSGLLARLVRRVRQTWPAFLVLCLGLLLSVVAWRFTETGVNAEVAGEFQQKSARAVEAIERRIQDNINLLLGLRGLFGASDQVTRQEFQQYLVGFDLERRHSVVRALSFSRHVTHAERDAFERRVRRDTSIDVDGYPQFAIKPPGTRGEYVALEYMEPMAGNEVALGLDLAADPVRRGEILLARDSGEPVASGPLAASINPNHISFALRVAVYRRGMPTQNVEDRRKAFLGVVAAVIHVDEMMGRLFGMQLSNDFELMVHDAGPWLGSRSEEPSARNLLYDSRWRGGAGAGGEGGPSRQVAMIEVAGRKWRLSFSLPGGARGAEHTLPLVVLAGSAFTSLLLFWVVWALIVSRERALKLAEHSSAMRAAEGLREQLAFIQQLIEAVPQPIFFKDAQGHYLGVNAAWEKFFGIPREQFIGKSVFELYPDNPDLARKHHAKDQELFAAPGSQSYEAAIVAADGKTHHTIYNKATFNNTDGTVAGLIGTITDISGLKEAEAALRGSEARFRDLTELSSDWYWEQDANLHFTLISSKVHEFRLGAEEDIGKARWEVSRVHMTDDQWQPHQAVLAARRAFQDYVYQRYDTQGQLRTISVSGRPIFDEQGGFQGYRGTGRDISEQRRAEEQIRHLAHHDALTQLPNRMLLHDRIGQAIAQARRNREMLALLFIDLDRFKMVNDSLGHAVGDRLLQSVADRLGACTRNSDTIARLGGDEFVVLLGGLAEPGDARHVAQKILDALAEPVTIDGHELKVTPSIGICAYPHDGDNVETLMRNADTAMYCAKQMGRNNCQFFTQAMNDAVQLRLQMENDLRHAIERGEFILHYQPVIGLKSGAIVGFEALVRWQHPQRGMIPPAQFIAAAEETGLIVALGEWVLRETCARARAWHEAGYPTLQAAVNCSAQQFRREGFVDMVGRVLGETGFPAACLELELTESVILERSEEVIACFQALDNMGVCIAIDDFGTGYSSLSYLKRFAIHQLKIDQSFVRDISSDPDDAAIVSAIIAIAHSLGLEVVAEGVETAEQLAFLRSLGCDKAQGYLFSKPRPAEAFAQLMSEWQPRARAVVGA